MENKNNKVQNIEPNLQHSTYTTEQGSDSSAQAQDTFPGVSGLEAGKLFVKHKFGYEEGVHYKVSNSYESGNGLTHVYLQQLNEGKEVDNGNINLNVDKNGKIISFGDSFDKSFTTSSNKTSNPEDWGSPVNALFSLFNHLKVDPKISQNEIGIQQAGEDIQFSNIPIAKGDVSAQQKFIQVKSGKLEKVWNLEVDLGNDIWSASVTPDGEVVRLNNLVSN